MRSRESRGYEVNTGVGGDQSEAGITLSDQSEASNDNSMICSSWGEKDNRERERAFINPCSTLCHSKLTNEKTVLSRLTNGRPAFIILMHHAARGTKPYLQDLSSYVLMSRKPRSRNGTEQKLSPFARQALSRTKMLTVS